MRGKKVCWEVSDRAAESSDSWPVEMTTYYYLTVGCLTINEHTPPHASYFIKQPPQSRHHLNCSQNRSLSRASAYLHGACSTMFLSSLCNENIPPSLRPPLPVQRIHHNGTRVSHFSLNEGFAGLWSLFQPSHTDGFLGPVICPVQVIGHPVHSYALYCVDAWDGHMLLVRSLLLKHT